MISMIFAIGIIVLCIKTGWFAIRAAWGIFKFMMFVIVFPLMLVGLFAAGIIYLAWPLLLIALLVSLIRPTVV